MNVDYIDHMGSDLLVVNAARVSFDNWKTELDEKDKKLINFLARNGHESPFFHPKITLRVEVPIFVANQLKRHQVGLDVNEVSRRYVTEGIEFYEPEFWRKKPKNVKQGSDGKLSLSVQIGSDALVHSCHYWSLEVYQKLLQDGVAPEQARMVLPQSTYTKFIWTGSLMAFARVCRLRLAEDTQQETREVAQMIEDVVQPLFPVSWKELVQ